MTVSARETDTEGSNHITFEFLCVVTGVARVRAFFFFSKERRMDSGKRGNKFVNTMDGRAQ